MSVVTRFLNLFRSEALQHDLNAEVQFHLQKRIERNLFCGMSRAEAEAEAYRRFGNVARVTEDMREARVMTWLESLVQDFRYGFRSLWRARLSSSAMIVMLALGIGANTAIFTLVNAIWLRPLPYQHADRLVTLLDSFKTVGGEGDPTVPEFLDIRSWTRSLEQMAFLDHRDFQVAGGHEPERVFGGRVTASFFPLLGVPAALGRVFRDEDNRPGNENVLILTDGLWRRAFGADRAIVGRELMLDGRRCTVVGVLPASFSFDHPGVGIPEPVDIYVPFLMNDYYTLRSGAHSNIRRVRALARLKDGYDVQSATAEIQGFAQRLIAEHPDLYRSHPTGQDMGLTMRVRPLQSAIVGETGRFLLLLFGAVAIVLLIACANTAQFLLARSFERQDEVAVRTALGASRRRLVQQFLSESMILAAAGGALGLYCSWLLVQAFVSLIPFRSPLLAEAGVDGTVLAFTIGVSFLTAILFGLVPSISASVSAGRRSIGPPHGGGTRPRRALIAVEVALSMVLLASTAALVRGMFLINNAPRGYSPDDVTVMRLRLSQPRPDMMSNRSLQYEQYLSRIREIPGVQAAAVLSGQAVPLTETNFVIGRHAADAATLARQTWRLIVSMDYFHALRIPLLEGRTFTQSDTQDRPPVVIINRELARRLWPTETAVGKLLRLPRETTVIGVVADTRMWGTALDASPQLYVPSLQYFEINANVLVRMAAGTAPPIQAFKEAIWSVAPEQAVFGIRSMDEIVSGTVAEPRFRTLLLGSFAVLAIVLSAVGAYGFVSYLVSRRTREIAIRMAIGAQRSDVFWLVSGQTIRWTLAGLAVGTAGAIAANRALSSTFQGVGSMDTPTLIAACAMYLLITAVAVCVPAQRAFRVDATRAFRYD